MFPQYYYNMNPYYSSMTDRMPIPNNYIKQNQQPGQMQLEKMPPSNFQKAPGSPTSLGIEYTQGYLKTQIGKRVKITFLIGTNLVQDRTGTLLQVGISYVIIRETETNSKVLCDIYSIKFVNIYD